MLQCHPHPRDFCDKSKQFCCSYFMGLRMKEGAQPQESKSFDIRITVQEFKSTVGSYTSWRPGMEIQVSHIKRRDIPLFVFPGGVRPIRSARTGASHRRQVVRNVKVPNPSESNKNDNTTVDIKKESELTQETIEGILPSANVKVEDNVNGSSLQTVTDDLLVKSCPNAGACKKMDVDIESSKRKVEHAELESENENHDSKLPKFGSVVASDENLNVDAVALPKVENISASSLNNTSSSDMIGNLCSEKNETSDELLRQIPKVDIGGSFPEKLDSIDILENDSAVGQDMQSSSANVSGISSPDNNPHGYCLEELEVNNDFYRLNLCHVLYLDVFYAKKGELQYVRT